MPKAVVIRERAEPLAPSHRFIQCRKEQHFRCPNGHYREEHRHTCWRDWRCNCWYCYFIIFHSFLCCKSPSSLRCLLGAISTVINQRRWRKRRLQNERDFNTVDFRRSAVLLKDETPDYFSPGNGGGHPRPPTMIERHMANASCLGVSPASFPQPPQYTSFSHGYQAQQPPLAPGQLVSAYGSSHPLLPEAPVRAHYVDINRVEQAVQDSEHKLARRRPDSVYTTVYNEEDAYGGM